MRDTILAAVVTRKHSDKVKGMNSIFIVEDEEETAADRFVIKPYFESNVP